MITLDNLYILNEIDRPCIQLIATKEPLEYVCPSTKRACPSVSVELDGMTSLKAFGFIQDGDKFIRVQHSIATYSDGRIRDWQDRDSFTVEDLLAE